MIEEDGKPIPATPVAGALLVNAGMSLQEFSGGYYSAVRHEVVRIRADVPRVSVVFFNDATDRPRTTGG